MLKKIGRTKFIIEVGDITKVSTDILFIWTVNKLDKGDTTWKAIHKAAGSALYDDCIAALTQYGIKNNIGEVILPTSRCVLTRVGFLDMYHAIHCVLPDKRVKEERELREMYFFRTIQNGLMLADNLAKSEVRMYKLAFYPISEDIFGDVSKDNLILFFKNLLKLKEYKEIRIVCEYEEDYEYYSSVFEKLTTPLWERWLNKIFKNLF